MFKLAKMRRANRAVNDVPEVIKAFGQANVMTLALKDEPFPYSVMVNYAPWLKEDDLYLIFHGARAGRKYELIGRDPQAAFSILLRDDPNITGDCKSSNYFKSLCGQGVIELLEGDVALEALCCLMAHHGTVTPAPELKAAMAPMLKATQTYALKVTLAGLKHNERP